MKPYSLLLALALLRPFAVVAQGTFRNMDFEQAQIPQDQPRGVVSADLAFPFWSVYYGNQPTNAVHWNETSVGATEASLIGLSYAFGTLGGGYSAYLWGGPTACSLGQVGQIPTDAASILFKARGSPSLLPEVTIGGVSLPLFNVSSGPNYTIYGVNVSQFAGMQEDLRFTSLPLSFSGPYAFELDDIVFSTTPVPEPTTGALSAIGGLLLGSRILRRTAPTKKAPTVKVSA